MNGMTEYTTDEWCRIRLGRPGNLPGNVLVFVILSYLKGKEACIVGIASEQMPPFFFSLLSSSPASTMRGRGKLVVGYLFFAW